jgi:hypothetical protein
VIETARQEAISQAMALANELEATKSSVAETVASLENSLIQANNTIKEGQQTEGVLKDQLIALRVNFERNKQQAFELEAAASAWEVEVAVQEQARLQSQLQDVTAELQQSQATIMFLEGCLGLNKSVDDVLDPAQSVDDVLDPAQSVGDCLDPDQSGLVGLGLDLDLGQSRQGLDPDQPEPDQSETPSSGQEVTVSETANTNLPQADNQLEEAIVDQLSARRAARRGPRNRRTRFSRRRRDAGGRGVGSH